MKLGHLQLEDQLSDGRQPCRLSQVSEETCATWQLVCDPTVFRRIHQIPIHGIRTALGISVLLKRKEERTPPSPK